MSAGFKSLGRVSFGGVCRFFYSFDGGISHRLYRRDVTRAEWRERYGLWRAAKRVLRHGDRVRCGRCGGAKPTYTFTGWDGWWAVSKSGIADLWPGSIDRINGKPVNFRELARVEVRGE